jgi:hypothetical protein
MKVEFLPLTEPLIPACRAFNERITSRGKPLFLLPETAQLADPGSPGGVQRSHHVAVDEDGEVRGGVLLAEQRGWLAGHTVTLVNIQSPLSEGAFDRRFLSVSLQMLKFVSQRSPYLYVVGMGGEQSALARFLTAAGWRVTLAPFLFSVVRACKVLREVGSFQHGPQRSVARLAATTGLGALGSGLWQLAHRTAGLNGYALEPVSGWPAEVDSIWERNREDLAFSAVRDLPALNDLYPVSQHRLYRFLLLSNGRAVGWSTGIVTAMKNDQYFGNLSVGTILDGLAAREHLRALLVLSQAELRRLGADLIITNQTHIQWRKQLRRLGFLVGPSNYALAISKSLAAALQKIPDSESRIHVNRGDGAGRLHL